MSKTFRISHQAQSLGDHAVKNGYGQTRRDQRVRFAVVAQVLLERGVDPQALASEPAHIGKRVQGKEWMTNMDFARAVIADPDFAFGGSNSGAAF